MTSNLSKPLTLHCAESNKRERNWSLAGFVFVVHCKLIGLLITAGQTLCNFRQMRRPMASHLVPVLFKRKEAEKKFDFTASVSLRVRKVPLSTLQSTACFSPAVKLQTHH